MRAFALILCLACIATNAVAGPKLKRTANMTWERDATWFGGFSGLEVAQDGETATLITDKGRLVTVKMVRNGARLTAMQVIENKPLKHANGRNLRGKSSDSEGLAIGVDGTAYLSFEHRHRVAKLSVKSGRTTPLPRPSGFGAFEENAGLEALAIAPNGSLFTLPERSEGRRTAFPLYQYANGTWRIAGRIPRKGPYLPVGADFDANGLFYLLERATTPLGFRSRIRRFNLNSAPFSEQVILNTRPSKYDNLEAISLWQDASGTTRVTLISDDNFLVIQRTHVVEFALIE